MVHLKLLCPSLVLASTLCLGLTVQAGAPVAAPKAALADAGAVQTVAAKVAAPDISAPTVEMVDDEAESTFDVRTTLERGRTNAAGRPAALLLGYGAKAPYLVLSFGGDGLQLQRVTGAARIVLARVTRLVASASSSISIVVQWRAGSLRVIYDGRTVLRRSDLGTLSGGVATSSSEGGPVWKEASVQPVEPVHFSDDFMRSTTLPGLWQPVTGTWKLDAEGNTQFGANPFSYVAQGTAAISLAGNWFWSDYTAATSVRAPGKGAVGLVAYWQDNQNYLLFKWYARDAAVGANKLQLWRVVRGQAALLGAAPGGYRPDQWYRLSLRATDGKIELMVDGCKVLEKSTDWFGQGKVGLYVDSAAPATFDDVQVVPADEVPALLVDQAASGPARFANDLSMTEWSSPKGQWLPPGQALVIYADNAKSTPTGQWLPAQGEPVTLWNRGLFFGNYAVAIKATGITATGARVDVVLAGDGTNGQSGYDLKITAAPDNKSVTNVLMRNGVVVSKVVKTPLGEGAGGYSVKIERNGNVIKGYLNDKQIASLTDLHPLAGRHVGYKTAGAEVAAADAQVIGGNMLDYTFYQAPTDWLTGSGSWELASRWICTPTWTWYSGVSDRIAALWNKRSFGGDFAIEVFAACKMDLPNPPHYLHPRDLNITVSGDGTDLASGYSCIFGGWNNTSTRILRGTQTVAKDDQVLLPSPYYPSAHHKWFCLRVEKVGDTISYYIDRKLTLQYKDKNPLQGRRIALWTSGNGIMIARATIYYQQQSIVAAAPAITALTAELPSVPSEKLNWTVRGGDPAVALSALAPVAPGEGPSVRAVDVGGGGNFAITPHIEPFDALVNSRLTFQCKLDRGAALNLYVKAKGITHAVRLTGPALADDQAGAVDLGSAPLTADNRWHSVSIDLGARLKALYPADTKIVVDELFVGNLGRDPYLQAGFSANTPGTSYVMRYFALRDNNNRLALLIEPRLQNVAAPTAAAQAGTVAAR